MREWNKRVIVEALRKAGPATQIWNLCQWRRMTNMAKFTLITELSPSKIEQTQNGSASRDAAQAFGGM